MSLIVGWVERSDTHRMQVAMMGIAIAPPILRVMGLVKRQGAV